MPLNFLLVTGITASTGMGVMAYNYRAIIRFITRDNP
jgi:hypothetical protein